MIVRRRLSVSSVLLQRARHGSDRLSAPSKSRWRASGVAPRCVNARHVFPRRCRQLVWYVAGCTGHRNAITDEKSQMKAPARRGVPAVQAVPRVLLATAERSRQRCRLLRRRNTAEGVRWPARPGCPPSWVLPGHDAGAPAAAAVLLAGAAIDSLSLVNANAPGVVRRSPAMGAGALDRWPLASRSRNLRCQSLAALETPRLSCEASLLAP